MVFNWFRRKDKNKEAAPPPEEALNELVNVEPEWELKPVEERAAPVDLGETLSSAGIEIEAAPLAEAPLAEPEVELELPPLEPEIVPELELEPVIEEPVIEEPVIEKPVIKEPVIEEPVIEQAVIAPEPEPEKPAEKKGFFARLRDRLSKTKTALVDKVRSAIRLHGKVDEELLEEIESILIQSDVGVPTTMKIVERIRTEGRKRGTLDPDSVLAFFKEAIEDILTVNARQLELGPHPTIILMIGVNGTGKTTTIGKLARQWVDERKRVMMVAADTFRAAAISQLAVWAERTGATLIRPEEHADPAAVVYDAMEHAKREAFDVILIDTAGRLHTKINLMEELKKIVRVIQKHYPDAPHETLLALDATTGQNAMNQVKIFHDACNLTGLIMTKLDGTAKGGVLIACKDMYALPILKIGIGEAAEDLRDFNPHEFVEALFSNNQGNGGGEKYA